MRIAGNIDESIVDGAGIRYVIFLQGCTINCKGCQNKSTQDINGGIEVQVEDVFNDINKHHLIDGVTFSGGEPFLQVQECVELAKMIRKERPELNIWSYSGYTFEHLIKDLKNIEFLNLIDVLVDGPFVLSKKSLNIPFRGSSNQRLIDVKKTLSNLDFNNLDNLNNIKIYNYNINN